MRRNRTIFVAIVSSALTLLPLAPASAARKKPSTDEAKSAPAGDVTSPDKKGTGTPLDLPLPADAHGENSAPAAAPKKDGESGSPNPTPVPKSPTGDSAKTGGSPNATIQPEAIAEFAAQSPRIQQLLRDAVDLTRLNLAYKTGSADPDNGGMDDSGAIYYLLRAHRLGDVPREAGDQYLWSRKAGTVFPVVSQSDESVEFNELLPGDLLFWRSAEANGQDFPITHVMLYLGKEKDTGKRIMFGASDGSEYRGVQRRGVSVFDFTMAKGDGDATAKEKVSFLGFARVPGLRSGSGAAASEIAGSTTKPPPVPVAQGTPKKKGKSKK
jgi:cell wall-associated NlpC family hydrolase